MRNVTIAMDDELARRARVAAAAEGKSLSRWIADLLAANLGGRTSAEAAREFLSGPLLKLTDENGRLPNRDEIYGQRERKLLR